jgi:hypothetical protein
VGSNSWVLTKVLTLGFLIKVKIIWELIEIGTALAVETILIIEVVVEIDKILIGIII